MQELLSKLQIKIFQSSFFPQQPVTLAYFTNFWINAQYRKNAVRGNTETRKSTTTKRCRVTRNPLSLAGIEGT